MSKKILKKINLDFARKTQPITVFAKQGDGEARTIIIQPMDNGVPFSATELAAWQFFCDKPDGHSVKNDSVTAEEDGTLTLLLSDQTLIAPGIAVCSVSGVNADGEQITSQNFLLDIEYTPGAYDTESGDETENTAIAGKYYTVLVPAAGASDLYGWYFNQSSELYELQIMDVTWMTYDLFLELKSENTSLFTEHNLKLYQDDGFLDFSIDTLPERESVLYIYVPTVVNGGQLNGGES